MTRSGSTIRAVCWDWNGTLLDDVERCMRIMNDTLAAFDRAPLASTSHYRSIFRFPLSDFYADAGIPSDLYRDAAWLDASGYAPGEVLMIGDTAHDREFAADLGARFVHFTQGAPGGGRRRGHRHP